MCAKLDSVDSNSWSETVELDCDISEFCYDKAFKQGLQKIFKAFLKNLAL